MEHGDLPLEAVDRPVHHGDPVPHRCVVDEVPGREVVRAVQDHVPAVGEDPLDVLRVEPLLERHDRDVRVERLDRPLRRVDLRLAEALGRVDDLPLEVRVVDDVGVDDPERPDARRCEVERRGRAEAAGADEEDARLEQPLLAFLADLGDQQVARVARPLRRRERRRGDELVAVPLPAREAVREVDRVLVAEIVERLRREGGAGAALAVDDERPRLVGDERLDTGLEVVARQVERAGKMTLVPLVARADVDEEWCVAAVAVEECARLRRRDLFDPVARGARGAPGRSPLLSRI